MLPLHCHLLGFYLVWHPPLRHVMIAFLLLIQMRAGIVQDVIVKVIIYGLGNRRLFDRTREMRVITA